MIGEFHAWLSDPDNRVLTAIVGLPIAIAGGYGWLLKHRFEKKKHEIENESAIRKQEFEEKKFQIEIDNLAVRNEVQDSIELIRIETQKTIADIFRRIVLNLEKKLDEANAILSVLIKKIEGLEAEISEEESRERVFTEKVERLKDSLPSLKESVEILRMDVIPKLEKSASEAKAIAVDTNSGRWETEFVEAQILRVQEKLNRIDGGDMWRALQLEWASEVRARARREREDWMRHEVREEMEEAMRLPHPNDPQ